MKITFVLPTVNISGGIRVALIHAKALRDSGHQVRLVFPPPKPPSFKENLKYFLNGKGWRRTTESNAKILSNLSMLQDCSIDHHVLKSWRPVIDADVPDADIIIATWWETAEWVAALSPIKGIKVYLIQGHEIFANVPNRAQRTYWLPLHKLVISKWLQEVMRVLYRDVHCSLVENAVDHSQFDAPLRGKQNVFTVGTLISVSEGKNHALAINTIIEAKKLLPNLRVVAFGAHKAPEMLPGWVEYHINPSQNKIPEIYSVCDAWLFTSRSEGFGLPILEAMACRTPVLSTYAGAAPEIISSNNGRLLPDSVEDFVQAITEFANMEDPDWKILSDNAYRKAREYSWDVATTKFELALTNLINSEV
ncbi:MAG: glycosyltransferase family 4 protein [Gammaproteobacteria bacterium]|nr:glycosyltransferase family 4 protein [Gammaproteobacteria bacterium]MBU1978203.1 glycosyltransferase family 4 protein [Gammaproteobacteria bacterium]